jgi:ABC-2 type transport system ATP-binding protein
MSAPLVVELLGKRYGSTVAVDGVGLAVEAGEIFGLLGANGAGKTTTLECIAGLRTPDSGRVRLGGFDPQTAPRAARELLGAVLQRTDLPDALTPREALHLFGSFYVRRTAPGPLLERFDLMAKADAPYRTLSGGQRQRLALALAFVNEPAVVLLDEPAAGLDPQARQELHALLLAQRGAGRAVLLSTHDLAEAEKLCDRVAILHRGRLVAAGTPRDLLAGINRRQQIRLRSAPVLDPALFGSLPGVHRASADGEVRVIETDDATATLAALTALLAASRATLVDLQAGPVTLEEAYLELTRDRPPEAAP